LLQKRKILKASIFELIDNLRSLHALAEEACKLTERLDDPQTIEELNDIDRKLLSHGAKDVAGFLLHDLATKILDGEKASSSINDVKAQSLAMYKSLTDSAEYHINLLYAETESL
jgi:hypothetical protein